MSVNPVNCKYHENTMKISSNPVIISLPVLPRTRFNQLLVSYSVYPVLSFSNCFLTRTVVFIGGMAYDAHAIFLRKPCFDWQIVALKEMQCCFWRSMFFKSITVWAAITTKNYKSLNVVETNQRWFKCQLRAYTLNNWAEVQTVRQPATFAVIV